MRKIIHHIAREILGLETLERRNRDRLDFHDLSVLEIKQALEAAYDAGFARGLARSRPLIKAADEMISTIMAAREHSGCAASKPSSGACALDEIEPACTDLLQRVEAAKKALKAQKARAACAFVNLIWPLLILSFGPTWASFRPSGRAPLLDHAF